MPVSQERLRQSTDRQVIRGQLFHLRTELREAAKTIDAGHPAYPGMRDDAMDALRLIQMGDIPARATATELHGRLQSWPVTRADLHAVLAVIDQALRESGGLPEEEHASG